METRYYLSSDVVLHVKLKISTLLGRLPLPRDIEVFVVCQVFSGM